MNQISISGTSALLPVCFHWLKFQGWYKISWVSLSKFLNFTDFIGWTCGLGKGELSYDHYSISLGTWTSWPSEKRFSKIHCSGNNRAQNSQVLNPQLWISILSFLVVCIKKQDQTTEPQVADSQETKRPII